MGCDGFKVESKEDGGRDRAVQLDENAEPSGANQAVTQSDFEAIDNSALIPIEVAGFDKLPLNTKKLVYQYYLAAMAGEPIYYGLFDQKASIVDRLLRKIIAVRKAIPSRILPKIERYAKLFWINRQNRGVCDQEKIIPSFIPGELAAAAEIAMNMGLDLGASEIREAKLGANRLDELEVLLKVIRPYMFDPDFEPAAQEPPSTDDEAVERVARAGREGVPGGLFAKDLSEVVRHLRSASGLLERGEKEAMEQLVDFLETGNAESLEKHNRIWTKTNPMVELCVNLAVDSPDFAQRHGSFKAIVALRDEDLSKVTGEVVKRAAEYEELMPWGGRYKKPSSEISLDSVDVFQAIGIWGRSGPVSTVDIDFPGIQTAWERHGEKRLYLSNLSKAHDRVCGPKLIKEFFAAGDLAARARKWRDTARFAYAVLRETLGRGSGRANPRLKGLPEDYLQNAVPILDEMRADLVALHLAFEPISRETGLVPEEDCAKAVYDGYASGMLEQLALTCKADKQAVARMRAKQIVVRFAIEKGAAAIDMKDGHFYASIKDYAAMRAVVRQLAAEIQRIRYMGDYKAGNRLINLYGTGMPAEWQKDIRSRWSRLELPQTMAFVYPMLKTELDSKGNVTDIRIDRQAGFVEHFASGQE